MQNSQKNLSLLLLWSCVAILSQAQTIQFKLQHQQTGSSLRGVSTVNDKVAWASGSKGTILKTNDGGATWQKLTIAGTEKLDFRDVEAFGNNTAYVISAGSPAKIYKTTDGGTTWQEQYSNTAPDIFFDALAFWNKKEGMAFGDPINGQFSALLTKDGGKTWQNLTTVPQAQAGEAGFAASGTCLFAFGKKTVYFGSGGAKARLLKSEDRGQTWNIFDTPILCGQASQGIFSVAFKNDKQGILVGGDYQQPPLAHGHCAITSDGGMSWQLIENQAPAGFRSGVVFVPKSNIAIAVGTNGSDISYDNGKSWKSLNNIDSNSISISPSGKTGWAVSSKGEVFKLIFTP